MNRGKADFRSGVAPDRFRQNMRSRHAAKLAVELDGKQHEWFSDYDAGRTEILERLGLHIVRFTNAEVSDDLDSVLARIRAELRLPFD